MQGLFERSSGTGAWLGALCLAAAAFLGCASTGAVDSSRELSGDAGFRVVVAPLNLAFPLPTELDPELDGEPDQIFAELLRYYLEQDAHVAIIAQPDAIQLWQESAAATPGGRGRARLDAVARSFARALGEQANFDLVVLPALIHRDVRLDGDLARWDGVQRRLRVRDRSTPGSRTMLTWNSKVAALSLYVLFVTREGGRVSEGRGGISLLEEVVLAPGGPEHAALVPSREVVSRPGEVREGVARALSAAPLP